MLELSSLEKRLVVNGLPNLAVHFCSEFDLLVTISVICFIIIFGAVPDNT